MVSEIPVVKVSVRELMDREGLNQKDLVKATGMTSVTVGRLYHGRSTRVDLETLGKLMAYFELTSFDQLLRKEPIISR